MLVGMFLIIYAGRWAIRKIKALEKERRIYA